MPTVCVFIIALGLFPHASKTNSDNKDTCNAHETLLVADKQLATIEITDHVCELLQIPLMSTRIL